MRAASNTRSNDEDEASFYNNRQNPIISLCEPSGSGKTDLHFFGIDARLRDERRREKLLRGEPRDAQTWKESGLEIF